MKNTRSTLMFVVMVIAACLYADNTVLLARNQAQLEQIKIEIKEPSTEENHTLGEQKNHGNHNNHQEQPEEEPALAPAAPPRGD